MKLSLLREGFEPRSHFITRPVIIQPDLSQGYNYTDLMRQAQLVCDSTDSLQEETI